MVAALELTGQKFGRLTVERRIINGKPYSEWLCRCDCGTLSEVRGPCLVRGSTRSCGCLRIEEMAKIGAASRTHGHGGDGGTPTYRSWKGMMERCLKPDGKDWPRYGARGISVHLPWQKSFAAFLTDMGEQPKGMTLERHDNNRDYCLENCRWASRKEQANNRSSNIVLTIREESLTAGEWAERLNLRPGLIYTRLRRGWTAEQALTPPRR